MRDLQKLPSQFFNFAGRFGGVCFVLVGVIFVIYGIASGGAMFAVPGLVVAVLGVLLICAQPYRPPAKVT